MRRNKGGVQRRPMDVGGKKLLHGAVAIRAPAGDIAHGDGVGCTKRAGNDGAQLTERSGRVNLQKQRNSANISMAFPLFFDSDILKLYRKSHFYATFNWRRY